MNPLHNLRSHFSARLVQVDGTSAILVVDYAEEAPHAMSVTNDAEAVYAYVTQKFGNHPVYYKDTYGQWDEIKLGSDGWADFDSIPEATKRKFNLHNL